MFTSARHTMPALDYVSIIRSVYADRKAMLAGAFASSFAAGLTAYKAQSLALAIVAVFFLILGTTRYLNMRAFWRAAIENDNAAAAEYWENRAVVQGGLLAVLYGAWCLVAMLVVRDPYAELVSATLSIAAMVGIVARNFGLDRLVAIQMLLLILPLSLGLLLRADMYHPVLAILLFVMLSSFRQLATNIRSILLSAVHGRVEASRLAAELDMAMTTLEHGLCLLDERRSISVANERAVQLFANLGVTQLVGTPLLTMLTRLGEDGTLPRSAVIKLMDLVDRQISGKVLLRLSANRDYEVTVSARRDRCVLLFEDISERVASQKRISFMARHDTLTNLPNRTHFGELVVEDLAARRSEPERTVSLMIIDIDDFKHVNDTFGHVTGDRLLLEISRRLRHALPPQAMLARLGGDEFVIYRNNITDSALAANQVQTVLGTCAAAFALDGVNLNVSVSMGVVTSSDIEDTLDDLMTKADLALYAAKADGKAKSREFHAQMDIEYHYRQRLKNDLRLAVHNNELTLAFQPLLDIDTRKVVSCEALARWEHPELGNIAPAVFIPLAEEMGLISAITAWVVQQAATQCSLWPGGVSVAVNISARDFRGLDLVRVVQAALDHTGLDPARFEVEVTETAVIEERETAHAVLTALAAKGIAIALDDFGTGYSSLSYLNALPFTKLKIDRSFAADIISSPRALRLLSNVARLGRDLDMTVVAEGVETEEQLSTMLDHTQIQQVQGYLFSRPLPERDISELIGHLNAVAHLRTANRGNG